MLGHTTPSPRRVSLDINNPTELAAVACRGKCQGIGVKGYNGSQYGIGMKYCSGCEIYFFSDSAQCFCCGRRLRAKLG